MKNISLKSKKFLVLSSIIVFVMINAQAQEASTILSSNRELAVSYNVYSQQYGCPAFQFRVFGDVTPKIALGGGFGLEGWPFTHVSSETAIVPPFHKLRVSGSKYGWALSAMYHFNKGHLELDGFLALCAYRFEAYDSQCEIVMESYESGPTTTHWFTLYRADGKIWYSGLSYTLTLSYLLPITNQLHLKFSAGYDFNTPVKKELVNEATALRSDWDEFETYYGQPIINLYEASEGVRKACSIGHLHIGFGLSYLF